MPSPRASAPTGFTMQDNLVKARLGVAVQRDRAAARKAEADGEACFRSETGKAGAVAVEAEGLARAPGPSRRGHARFSESITACA